MAKETKVTKELQVNGNTNVTPVNETPKEILVNETPKEQPKEEKPKIIFISGIWGRDGKTIEVTNNLKLKRKITNKNLGGIDPYERKVKELLVTAEFKGIQKSFRFMENEYLDIFETDFQMVTPQEDTIK